MNQNESAVFVVDDDRSMCEALAGLIAAAAQQVTGFASAQEFLRHPPIEALAALMPGIRVGSTPASPSAPALGKPGGEDFELQRELASGGRGRCCLVLAT